MEMKLDVGENVYVKLEKHAKNSSVTTAQFALDMLDLGLRVHQSSLEKTDDIAIDDGMKYAIETNEIVKEMIRCVFDKTKTTGKFFDADTLITMIENKTLAYLKGKSAR
jgi:methyl coenzyme M reductase subunit D